MNKVSAKRKKVIQRIINRYRRRLRADLPVSQLLHITGKILEYVYSLTVGTTLEWSYHQLRWLISQDGQQLLQEAEAHNSRMRLRELRKKQQNFILTINNQLIPVIASNG